MINTKKYAKTTQVPNLYIQKKLYTNLKLKKKGKKEIVDYFNDIFTKENANRTCRSMY